MSSLISVAVALTVILLALGCSSSKASTVTTTPLMTDSSTPTITLTPTNTTSPADTLLAVAALIKTHGVGAGYAGNCLICHGEGSGTSQFPLPPAWAGSLNTPGPLPVMKESDADHTGRTNDTCTTQTGCHKVK